MSEIQSALVVVAVGNW